MTHLNKPTSSKLLKSLLSIVLGATLITTAPMSAIAAPGSPIIFINGQQQSFDQSPVLLENRVYVPVRALLEAFGYEVKWNDYIQNVVATKKNRMISLNIQDQSAFLNESVFQHYYGDVPLVIHQGRSMISVRAVSELLGLEIQWDATQQAVKIDTASIALFDAILQEDLYTVRTLLEDGTDPNSKRFAHGDSSSALDYALTAGTPSIIQSLLSAGATFEEDDFRLATQQGDAEITNMLLTTVSEGKDPSQLASKLYTMNPYLNTEVSKTLLELGADPNYANGEALRIAVSARETEMIQNLLAAGADPNTPVTDKNMYPVLFDAASVGSLELVNLLLAHKADPNVATWTGWTPLMIAAEHGNVKLIQLLLANGADIHTVNQHGGTALAIAAAHGNNDTVKALLDNGATEAPPVELPEEALFYDTSIAKEDTYAPSKAAARGETHKVLKLLAEDNTPHRAAVLETVFYHAIRYGHVELFNKLLKEIPDLHLLGAMYLAAEEGNEEIFRTVASLYHSRGDKTHFNFEFIVSSARGNLAVYQTLLELGYQPNSADPQNTPLQSVAFWGLPEIVKLFVEAGADPNLFDDHLQETALDTAIRSGHPETLKALLTSDKLTEKTTGNALITAVKRDSLSMVTLLLEAGADVQFQTPDGRYPLQQAKENGSEEMIQLLISAGGIE